MDIVLIGAGGHAKAVVETLIARGDRVAAYVDPKRADWLDARQVDSDEAGRSLDAPFVLGLGGVEPEQLARRLDLLDSWLARSANAPPVVHESAVVSASAKVGPGAIILARAVVQPDAEIGRGVIVNTGAIVEHDSVVEAGTHVGPGAILLGQVRIGGCTMVGAGAVVLPGANLPERSLVKAGSVSSGSAAVRP